MNLIWGFTFGEAIDPETQATIKVDIHDYDKVIQLQSLPISQQSLTHCWNIDHFCQGILTWPNPFKCAIQVRSTAHAQLIRSEFAQARETFLPFEGELYPEDVVHVSKLASVPL